MTKSKRIGWTLSRAVRSSGKAVKYYLIEFWRRIYGGALKAD